MHRGIQIFDDIYAALRKGNGAVFFDTRYSIKDRKNEIHDVLQDYYGQFIANDHYRLWWG